MNTIKCPNCGHTLPADSAFCNKCGTRIGASTANYNRDYEDWSDNPATQGNAEYNDSVGGGSNVPKYILIAVGIIAFLSLFWYTQCRDKKSGDKQVEPVSIVDKSNSAAADALQRALNDNNYVGDGARIVYAMRINGSEPGVNDKIIGLTQLSGKGAESFYKLYELTQNGDKWNIDPDHVKQISTAGYDVSFDQDKLKAGIDMIPQSPEIDGKKYFFFAFLRTPAGTPTDRAAVVLNLYDVESRNITSATYEGTFQNVGGEQSIVCRPAQGNAATVQWMNEQARNFIRILALNGVGEQNEDAQLQQQPVIAEQPVAAAPAATEQPAEQAAPTTVGEEKDKDTPMFSKDDILDTKQAGNYKVFQLKDGRVVRYDKSTGKNTVIHQGGTERIGFADTEKGILNIRNSDGSLKQVNLNNGQQSAKPAAAPAEKKEETPKPAAEQKTE